MKRLLFGVIHRNIHKSSKRTTPVVLFALIFLALFNSVVISVGTIYATHQGNGVERVECDDPTEFANAEDRELCKAHFVVDDAIRQCNATQQSSEELNACLENITPASDGYGSGLVVDDATSQTAECDVDAINVIFWMTCEVLGYMFSLLRWGTEQVILPLLVINPLKTDGVDGLYNVWKSFRIIARIAFVMVFMIAIIGQTFSWFFTSYELKKIIPRLVIGAIAVELSWYFAGFMIDVFAVLGAGIRSLMLAPLDGLNANIKLSFDDIGSSILANVGLLVTAGSIYAAGGFLTGLPLVLFPVVLGVVIAVVTVLLRQVIIYLLVVTSPLAFVAWILPTTESLFKKWWSYFWKALAMYPLIVALISAGEFLSRIIDADSGQGYAQNIFVAISSVMALFGPYFLIPATFRFAGGVINNAANAFNAQGQKLNQTIFGDARDPESYRGRRREKQLGRQGRLAKRALDKYSKRSKYDPRRLTGLAALATGRGSEFAGAQLVNSREFRDLISGNGDDEIIYATVGNINPHTGQEVSQSAKRAARHYRGDEAAVQAALEYVIANKSGGTNEHLDRALNSFVNGENQSGRDFGGVYAKYADKDGMQAARLEMVDRMANDGNIGQSRHRDLAYRSWDKSANNGSGGFVMPQYNANATSPEEIAQNNSNLDNQRRMVEEASSWSAGQLAQQGTSYWDGHTAIANNADAILQRYGGDRSLMTESERQLVGSVDQFKGGQTMQQAQRMGGKAGAVNAQREYISRVNNIDWSDPNVGAAA